MKKITALSFVIFLTIQASFGQKHILPKFIRKVLFEKDSSKRGSFIIIPAISSAPETGLEAGASALYSFYTDTLDHRTRTSNVFAYATATTKGQSNFTLSSSYWLPQNKYHYSANLNYVNFPFNFYGTGNNTRKADEDRIGLKRFKVNLGGEKLFGKNIYLGYVLGGFNHQFNDKKPGGIYDTDPSIQGRTGGASLFVGPSFIFDSRNNNNYTTKGIIITSYYNIMHGIFANNSYTGGFFNIEYSQFFLLSKHLVLGLDVQEQSLTGGGSPFYLLPAMGSDEMMRGYYNGRFRDRNFIAGQTELRYRVSDRLGAVIFAGTGEVFHNAFKWGSLKPDLGAGLRYFFDVEKGLSIRLDYGVGEKRAGEPRQSGVYFGIGQSF